MSFRLSQSNALNQLAQLAHQQRARRDAHFAQMRASLSSADLSYEQSVAEAPRPVQEPVSSTSPSPESPGRMNTPREALNDILRAFRAGRRSP